MSSRPPTRQRSRPSSARRPRKAPGATVGQVDDRAGTAEPGAAFEDIAGRAARLGVTPERVLREYARIAFADLRHIVEWDEQGLHVKSKLSKADAAPIAEIGTGSAGKGPVRIKLYDKKAALDAIARYLGMFAPAHPPAGGDDAPSVEDVREELAWRLARLAVEGAEDEAPQHDEPSAGREDQA